MEGGRKNVKQVIKKARKNKKKPKGMDGRKEDAKQVRKWKKENKKDQ